MKKITSLIAIVTMASMMYAQCDVNGNYRVTALDVQYYDIARQATNVTVYDAYNQGVPVVLQTINVGDMFYGTHSGPYNAAILDQIGVNLNVNFNEDCTASLAAGSYYPDVNEENCVSSVQVLPITDDMTFTSNQTAVSPLPATNMVGFPSISARAGEMHGGLSLSEALIFDYFPEGSAGYLNQVGADMTPFTGDEVAPVTIPVPVNYPIDVDGNGELDDVYPANVPLPGIHGGWITIGDVGPSQIGGGESGVPLNTEAPSGYAEWHAIDGPASESGLGDQLGNDEDGFDGDYDRTFGLPVIPTATYFTGADGCDAVGAWAEDLGAVPVAGDVVGTLVNAVEAGCYAATAAGVAAQCEGAGGVANTVYGGCVAQATDDAFAAGCAAAGVAAAVTQACIDAGGPATADEAAAVGSPVTCGDLAASYEAGCAASDDPCACAITLATSTDSASLCSLAGAIGAGTYASCNDFAGSFENETLDGYAVDATGATCPQTAGGWEANCVAGVDVATDVWVMNPDPNYAYWSQFVTWNGIQFGACYGACVASGADGQYTPGSAEAHGYCGGVECGAFTANDSDVAFDPACLADGDPSDCAGRWLFQFAPTCIPEIEVRQVVIEFNELGGECANSGDANEDNTVNVMDVVSTVAFILGNGSLTDGGQCEADSNADGLLNVMDVVLTVNTILGNTRAADATNIMINKSSNEVSFDANGYVGAIQMTLSHGNDFSIEITDDALVADYNTEDNKTTLIVVNPETTDLFAATGMFTIDEVLASSDGYNYVNVDMNMPISYTISDAYPNPFNPTTSIDIALDTDANISVKVFNIMGQLVDVISEGNFAAGSHSVAWDASQISSGVYFVNTEVGSETSVQKIMLVK